MLRKIALVAALSAALPAAAFDVGSMSDEERAAFRAEIRSYLLDNPEVITEAIEALETRERQLQAEADKALVAVNLEALVNDGYSYVGGNPEGDITIVEFLDYRCGFCRRAHPEVEELITTDGNIRLIVKEFPILGEASMTSSRFAVAVKQLAGNDAYKTAHDTLIELTSDPSQPVLRRLAESLGLDAIEVLSRMNSDEVTTELLRTRALAQAMQINGTPSFVIGDEMIRGFVPLEGMRQIVEEQRS